MTWHIKIGKLAWCKSPYAARADFVMVAKLDGVAFTCMHVHKETADKMVAFLQRHGVDYARVVQGPCDN
jgi:hypothetical protein